MSRLTDSQLAELERLASGVTALPLCREVRTSHSPYAIRDARGYLFAEVDDGQNAEYMVAAANATGALVAEVRAARAMIADLAASNEVLQGVAAVADISLADNDAMRALLARLLMHLEAVNVLHLVGGDPNEHLALRRELRTRLGKEHAVSTGDERCPRCDRVNAFKTEAWTRLRELFMRHGFVTARAELRRTGPSEHCYGMEDCIAVDWRSRCLKAEQMARDNDSLVQDLSKDKTNLATALADRDQQIAALREDLAKEQAVAWFLGGVVDEYRSAPDRSAIEAEIVDEVAAWLESRGQHLLRMAADDVRAGEWRTR